MEQQIIKAGGIRLFELDFFALYIIEVPFNK